MENVIVIAEHDGVELAPVTRDLLAWGAQLAGPEGGKLGVILVGSCVEGMAKTLAEAADTLYADILRKRLLAVYKVLQATGPCHNDELTVQYRQFVHERGFPPQTDQSVRSRRAELTVKGLCVDTGERVVLNTGRKAVVWRAV